MSKNGQEMVSTRKKGGVGVRKERETHKARRGNAHFRVGYCIITESSVYYIVCIVKPSQGQVKLATHFFDTFPPLLVRRPKTTPKTKKKKTEKTTKKDQKKNEHKTW